MDKYTKFILTVIAVALVGILFKGEINKPAYAASNEIHKIAICDLNGNCVGVTEFGRLRVKD